MCYHRAMDIKEIAITSAEYPEGLRHIHAPPEMLYIRGELLPEDVNAVAIVGSRKCTHYGKQVAYDLANALARRGITVVSGMALGIDAEAHKGALAGGGRTIAVLGTGVDDASIYPHTHKPLAEQIMQAGAVLSEFEPGTPAYPSNFPQRNRIIAGLSYGTVIVEADERSGSLITARFALEQGREVFAVPGQIYSRTTRGVHRLIQEGAKLITSVEDIIEELPQLTLTAVPQIDTTLTEDELRIIELITQEPTQVDHLIKHLALPSHATLGLLAMLELKDKIQHIGNNTYAIKK
ncbi:MAG: DNA-processing protein DprA [Candidatus Azambacteria bacterium]|nr:DNA-processing protein DprA [Candidatus Azambacteria bacterium]